MNSDKSVTLDELPKLKAKPPKGEKPEKKTKETAAE
jgi:hypothetical protein